MALAATSPARRDASRRIIARVASLGLVFGLVLAGGCRKPPEPDRTPVDSGAAAPQEPAKEPGEHDPLSCDNKPCEPPRECIRYYGIAGASGPVFYACEIRCEQAAGNDGCPDGTRCVTIADGPGDVCR